MPRTSIDPPTCAPDSLWAAMLAPYYFPTLLVADEIGLFAWLHGTPATTAEVAAHYGMQAHAAEAMLGVLASNGHLAQHAGRFHLTESSRQFLLPDSVFYLGPALELRRKRPIDHSVIKELLFRSRSTGPTPLLDNEMWRASEVHVERHRASTASMHALFFPAAVVMAREGDFSGVARLLDVAGGSGCFCIALAARHPAMRCTMMDLPVACALAEEYIGQFSVADRVAVVAADMFGAAWPSGHDAHLFSNVFHDWDVERCRQLAARSFAALPPGGRIFVHESLLNDTLDGPALMTLYSMNMARVTEHGKQYSASELIGILQGAGFTGARVTHTWSIFSLVSARKP